MSLFGQVMTATNSSLIFTYGTLKQGYANDKFMQDLIRQEDAFPLGLHVTHLPYPLVLGPHGIPYLINLPGSGHQVRGELYAVTTRGLARLDELEETRCGHYERLPVQVKSEGNSVVVVEAKAYYAHRSFGKRLWERKGRVGLREYGEKESREWMKQENRLKGHSFLDDIELFVSSSSD